MKQFTIEENDADQRLDKFLKKLFPSATRSLIYKFNRKDKIKIKSSLPHLDEAQKSPQPPLLKGEHKEGKFRKRDNEYKLQIGDEIKIFLTDDDFETLSRPPLNTLISKEGRHEALDKTRLDKKDIVFEDASLLVINKNPGINVHPGDFKTTESSVITQVQDYLGGKLDSLTFKPSLVHRIDRDTSGILMIAKRKQILTRLVADFKTPGDLTPSPSPARRGEQRSKKIQKIYYTILLGKLSRSSGTITKKLLRIEGAKNQNKVQVSDKGLTAVTHYKKLQEHTLKTKEGLVYLTEVEVQIETGRMHQIRVHMAALGTPIIGDSKYGDQKMNAFFKNNYGLTRQALHAWKIDFFHYGRDKKMQLEARVKDDLREFLKRIKK